jgi:hypothetical protein
MVLTVSFVLPGDRLVDTVACGVASADLTPAPRCQDHTTSPSASAPFVKGAARVHRIPPPTSVTIAKRPSEEAGRNRYIPDFTPASREISEIPKFTATGLAPSAGRLRKMPRVNPQPDSSSAIRGCKTWPARHGWLHGRTLAQLRTLQTALLHPSHLNRPIASVAIFSISALAGISVPSGAA